MTPKEIEARRNAVKEIQASIPDRERDFLTGVKWVLTKLDRGSFSDGKYHSGLGIWDGDLYGGAL